MFRLCASIALIALAACSNSDSDSSFTTGPSASASRTQPPRPDARQQLYDAFLEQARSDTAGDPEQQCNLDYQQLVIDQVDATGAEKALIQAAMLDACIEVGEIEANYSPYYSP